MTPANTDPALQSFREQIAALDRTILHALNARIALVQQLKDHKERMGLAFYDPAQEAKVLADLAQANPGPISTLGLQELYAFLLDWTKREVAGKDRG